MINILIAEDDFRVASIHEQFLQKINEVNVVDKAHNAKETLEKLEEDKNIDLVLLDIYLPDQLGTELLPILRKEFPQVDVIIITAATEKQPLEESIRNGVFHYLIKPVTFEKVQKTIKNYLERKRLLNSADEVNQYIVDKYFGEKIISKPNYPKGIDPLSLEKVKTILSQIDGGITAEEMGEQMGASRTTARRYLEYLVSINEVVAELEYGIVGRPERKYFKV